MVQLSEKQKLEIKKNNQESMDDVLKIWEEIDRLKQAMEVSIDKYPYETPLFLYNQHQNILKSLLNDKMDELKFIEKIIDSQNTKYNSLDYVNS